MPRLADISIRHKLVFLLILTGIIPLIFAGFYGSRLTVNALMEKSFNQLLTVQNIRKNNLEETFYQRKNAMKMLSMHPQTLSFVEISSRYHSTHDPRFLPENNVAKKEYFNYLTRFVQANGFLDLVIISAPRGHIMFSMKEETHPDGDLFKDRYNESGLAKAFKQVVETHESAMIDFSPYTPSNNIQCAFLAEPIFDTEHRLPAVLIAQLPPTFLTELIDSRKGMGETGESYIVNWENETNLFEMRSTLQTLGEGRYVNGFRLGRSLGYWEDAVKSGEEGGNGTYLDSDGNEVLSAYNELSISGVNWYLISKIDKYEVEAPVRTILVKTALVSTLLLLLIGCCAYVLSRMLTRPIIEDVKFAQAISEGKFDTILKLDQKDELGILAEALNRMAQRLADLDWMKKGKEGLDDAIRGDDDDMVLARRFIHFIVTHLKAQLGALYIHEEGELSLLAGYAFTDRQGNFNRIKMGEGMIGQAALEQEIIIFNRIRDDAPMINYGAGELPATSYMIVPLHYEDDLYGVFLVGSITEFTELQRRFITQNVENVSIVMNAARSRKTIGNLYEKAREQQVELLEQNKALEEKTRALQTSESELQAQQEELRVANEELEVQAKALKKSQADLQAQQEELRVTNEELESHAKAQLEQKEELEKRNDELMEAQRMIEKKANELEIAGKYKSEFLANMSHELRTPLNSILILSQLFARNKEGNLTEKQIQSADAIHSSGEDLLTLINEILDLSKVEAGKIELLLEYVDIDEIVQDLMRIFKGTSEQKGVAFTIDVHPNLPKTLYTDVQRVQQILRNLLSNAFKFTKAGEVSLKLSRPTSTLIAQSGVEGINPDAFIAIAVRDQGIGIPKVQQDAIFQAFKQADGSTSRQYGGTGLGLAISKELAKLLGGWIHLESEEGKGSLFTVVIPESYDGCEIPIRATNEKAASEPDIGHPPHAAPPKAPSDTNIHDHPQNIRGNDIHKNIHEGSTDSPPHDPANSADKSTPPMESTFLKDDRKRIKPNDKTLLIIEDDYGSAKIMRDFARERDFKCIVAETGETGLHFADYYRPSAIILDIALPGIDGWTVMERLKSDSRLSHIPVHFMSAADSTMDAMRMGAIGFLAKPVSLEKVEEAFSRIENIISRPVRNLLVVEDDAIQRESIKTLIGNGDVKTTLAENGEAAMAALSSQQFDCIILDLGLEGMSGYELLDRIHDSNAYSQIPVIVYTGRDLTREEENELRRYTERIIIKGVKSPERLLEESALFLHRVEENLPKEKRRILQMSHNKEEVLKGKTILLVDDDMRNVFALSSVLEEKELDLVIARDGVEGLEKLTAHPEVDLVLMDIMMPNMDGYQAMAEIRKDPENRKLPIIALTAKAMKGDRDKCIEAGASDYLAKPVDMDKLISMLKVWLYR